jgi:hypothetical protein
MKRILGGAMALLSIAVACSSESESDPGNGSSSASSSGAASSSGTGSSSGETSSSGDPGPCTPTAPAPAEPAPLDLHILLDASGSMADVATGGTKWSNVKTALKAFFADPKNAGVGVGLQIFPIVHAGAPASCTTDNDCAGGFGACFKKACDTGANGALLPCDASSDCPDNALCGTLLACGPSGACVQNGTSSVGCAQVGCSNSATALATSQCAKKECFLEDYDEARVPVEALPANQAALTSNVDAMAVPPNTALTPTSTALAGALAFALQRASTNLDRVVALVLLSDGVPTRCPPYTGAGMASFVSAAAGSASPVRTHVVGLLTPPAVTSTKPLFDAIASAGGTSAAAIVLTNVTDVSGSLRAELDKVRSEGMCALKPPAGEFGRVGLLVGGAPVTKKTGAAGCDANGGFYPDVDPAAGTPRKILLCPTTCATVKAGAQVETQITCP